jgi:hypothetical protein
VWLWFRAPFSSKDGPSAFGLRTIERLPDWSQKLRGLGGASGITVTSTSLYKAYKKLTQSLYKSSANTKLLPRLHYTKLVQGLHTIYTKLYTKLTPSLYQVYTKLIHSNQSTSSAFGQLGACKFCIVCVRGLSLSLPLSRSLRLSASLYTFAFLVCVFASVCVCFHVCFCMFLFQAIFSGYDRPSTHRAWN